MFYKSMFKLHTRLPLTDIGWSANLLSLSTTARQCGLQEFCRDIAERNLVANSHPHNLANDQFKAVSDLPNVVYAGFDASADSLHVGNLVVINALLRAVLHDCKSVALVGQTTAVAGDPSGRTSARKLKERHVIATNANSISTQIKKIVTNFYDIYYKKQNENVEFVNNSEWYNKMSIEEYLEIGHSFRVGEMHRLAAVKSRIQTGIGIDCSEFSYQNLQAIDWYNLTQKYNCYFQIGGSDQLGNFDAGYDYIRRVTGKVSAALGLVLVTNRKGEKFGKSVTDPSASVWLSDQRTSPFAFFQFWRQLPDNEIVPLLMCISLLFRYFSLKPIEEISATVKKHEANLGQWVAQEDLATEMTRLIHGEDGLKLAQRCTKALFSDSLDDLAKIPDSDIQKLFGKASTRVISRSKVRTIGDLADFAKDGLPSGRVVMKKGGLRLNGKRYVDPDEAADFKQLFLGGKKLTIACWRKRHYQLVVWMD